MRPNKSNRAARGYGPAHQTRRAAIAPYVATGRALCADCLKPILPGEKWDLGHSDDRRSYVGPEHAGCNRRKAALKRNRRLASRSW